jgi:ubiquinone/menaquinone biosynthesis C-methylase UbiE
MINLFIKDFWNNQGDKFKESHWASWGDHFMINLEIELISGQIGQSRLILDVGCANGFSAFKQLETHPSIEMIGIDFAEKMINTAKQELKEKHSNLIDRIQFDVGDICKLNFEDEIFDLAYTTRVLINLPNWELQKKGIDEMIRVVKKGGRVVLLEAFWEPLNLLNAIRALKSLPPLVEHDFNRYLKIKKIDNYLSSLGLQFERVDFSSIYYLGSRFLRELVTDIDKYEGYSNPINELFFNIEKEYSGGGFGIQQAYIIQK